MPDRPCDSLDCDGVATALAELARDVKQLEEGNVLGKLYQSELRLEEALKIVRTARTRHGSVVLHQSGQWSREVPQPLTQPWVDALSVAEGRLAAAEERLQHLLEELREARSRRLAGRIPA